MKLGKNNHERRSTYRCSIEMLIKAKTELRKLRWQVFCWLQPFRDNVRRILATQFLTVAVSAVAMVIIIALVFIINGRLIYLAANVMAWWIIFLIVLPLFSLLVSILQKYSQWRTIPILSVPAYFYYTMTLHEAERTVFTNLGVSTTQFPYFTKIVFGAMVWRDVGPYLSEVLQISSLLICIFSTIAASGRVHNWRAINYCIYALCGVKRRRHFWSGQILLIGTAITLFNLGSISIAGTRAVNTLLDSQLIEQLDASEFYYNRQRCKSLPVNARIKPLDGNRLAVISHDNGRHIVSIILCDS